MSGRRRRRHYYRHRQIPPLAGERSEPIEIYDTIIVMKIQENNTVSETDIVLFSHLSIIITDIVIIYHTFFLFSATESKKSQVRSEYDFKGLIP